MFGVGLLVGLGRRLVTGALADSGWLPAGYYRHLVLTALEEEDFAQALHYVGWAEDPLLVQLIILRLRLLKARHGTRRHACQEAAREEVSPSRREKMQELVAVEDRAVALLQQYEERARRLLRKNP